MAKEVTHVVEFRDPFQHPIGPDREILVVATDDGSLYEFQTFAERPAWSLRRRGHRDTPVAQWTQSRARLPSDVTDTMDDIYGKKGWMK